MFGDGQYGWAGLNVCPGINSLYSNNGAKHTPYYAQELQLVLLTLKNGQGYFHRLSPDTIPPGMCNDISVFELTNWSKTVNCNWRLQADLLFKLKKT